MCFSSPVGRSTTLESSDGKRRVGITEEGYLEVTIKGGGVNKILGQLQPGNTPAPIYVLPADKKTEVRTMVICNTGNVDATFNIFLDPTGITYSAAKALFYGVYIGASETKQVDISLGLDAVGSSIGVQSSVAEVTFTLSGEES